MAASAKSSTWSSYATAVRHMQDAEKILGHSFSLPPTPQEMSFFVNHLAKRGISSSTISNYISAIRTHFVCRGAPPPQKLDPVTTHLLKGIGNVKKDALSAVLNQRRRPISLPLLRLICHAIAVHPDWSAFDKQLRHTACLLAFWGSFRIGELCSRSASSFDPQTDLLGSDVTASSDSVLVWVRAPKVPSPTGDFVEVWKVGQFPEVDPVPATTLWIETREQHFGYMPNLPFFLLSDGQAYSRVRFNKDLKELIATFPDLAGSPRDSWTGHSFRSGIATLLTALGFSPDDVKAWGRWRSNSWIAYSKDISRRRAVQQSISLAFDRIPALGF